MKLKDDDIIQSGDAIHWKFGGSDKVAKNSSLVGKEFSCAVRALGGVCSKFTRKTPRVSRKEWKRRALDAEARIERALEYVRRASRYISSEGEMFCGTTGSETETIVKILRGEE